MIVAIGVVVTLAVCAFQGTFSSTAPVTVLSARAGLVMNPGAKVKFHGAEIGTVTAVSQSADGHARLELAIDSDRMSLIPRNVTADIAPNTVFGAKSVELVAPPDPTPLRLAPGQVLVAEHVTVEANTLFDELNSVLKRIDPASLNATLTALSQGLDGRGEQLGQTIAHFDHFLSVAEPALPALSADLRSAPTVAAAYDDAAPDLIGIIKHTTSLSHSIVDEKKQLDTFLVSMIGLGQNGNDVLGVSHQALSDVLRLLLPTTSLTNEYSPALKCVLKGMIPMAKTPPEPWPGLIVTAAVGIGVERYRYPQNLPKVAATGGPQCKGQIPAQYNTFPPYVVSDTGANPWQYGNQGPVLNSDGLKQLLFGPIDGPPRNSAQIGQPG
jgi:phospholipid/cholesterol/gamma-HCH transport system substrate-binding protein